MIKLMITSIIFYVNAGLIAMVFPEKSLLNNVGYSLIYTVGIYY